MKLKLLALTLAACASFGAHAASSINLSSYTLSGTYSLPTLGGMGLEGSAITYAADRDSLFFVGDEGLGVIEVSKTGSLIGSMSFSAWPTTTTHRDAEGLTYLGGGVLVVGEERLQDAFKFSYVAGGSVNLANAPWASISNYTYNNVGLEGLSYDPRDGSFVSVKQNTPQEVRAGSLNFAVGGGSSTMAPLFNATTLSVASLSDVQTLSPIAALAGSAAADNLLILSLDSKRLLEVNRSGSILGSMNLASLTNQAIEGVTVDTAGNIYLIAEHSGSNPSQLFVLSAPVPEPQTWAMLIIGLAGLGWKARRKQA